MKEGMKTLRDDVGTAVMRETVRTSAEFEPDEGIKDVKPKEAILQEAIRLTRDDRNKSYGEPQAQFACAASLITAYLANTLVKSGGAVTAQDVSMMQVLTKVSRIACGQYKEDNYVDGAGYMAIAGELGREEHDRQIAAAINNNKSARTSSEA